MAYTHMKTIWLGIFISNGPLFVFSTCNINWQQFGNYCYTTAALSTNPSPNFYNAFFSCNNILGNLPTFNTYNDWTDFLNFVITNNISGVSALGYQKYNASITNPNITYTSLYDGTPTHFTNWLPAEPNLSYNFLITNHSWNNYWEATNSTTNPMIPVCQQSLVYDSNFTYVPCAPLCRSYGTNYNHRFTTDPHYCSSGGLSVENLNIGYTVTMHTPSLTDALYEMVNNITGRLLTAYNSTGRNIAIGFGYNTLNRVTYVSTVPISSTAPYFLLWNSARAPTDSLVSPLNAEYNLLVSSGWVVAASFHLFTVQNGFDSCSLSQNCTWNVWQQWSSCTTTCDQGVTIRYRTKNITENHGGLCDNIFNETIICNVSTPCPFNCTWNDWQSWSNCSASCGNGTHTRLRSKNITQTNGGVCDDIFVETNSCNNNQCPTNCTWNPWQNWSSCFQTCGNGTQTRQRSKNNTETFGGLCDNIFNDTISCNTMSCPIDCVWNEWEEWSNCTAPCNSGTTQRIRSKNITNMYGGQCDNVYQQTNTCNSQPCPIDCKLTQWSPFGTCSVTCVGSEGTKKRSRTIVSQPVHGGQPCPTFLQEYKSCTSSAECVTDTMPRVWRTVATIMQSIGCTFTIGSLSTILLLFFFLRIYNFERVIHMCQEMSLLVAHIAISLFAFKMQADAFNKGVCLYVSILLQFCFLAYYTFLALECMHDYCILTNVTVYDHLFPLWQLLAIGFGAPALVTIFTSLLFYRNYVSKYSCWVNWNGQASAGTMLPILLLVFIAVIFSEACNVQYRRPLLGSNSSKRISARISQHSMIILIPLHLIFWIVASIAVYHQHVALYCIVFALNIAFAFAIFIFHVAGNEWVNDLIFRKFLKSFKGSKKSFAS